MIEIIDQSSDDYFFRPKIVGISRVNYQGMIFIMFHDDQITNQSKWSITYADNVGIELWANSDKYYNHRVSRAEFIEFVIATTPQCIDWLLFHINEIDSGEIFK